MSEETDYGLILSFDDQSPSFVYGWEAGVIWQRLTSGERETMSGTLVHTDNAPMVDRILGHFGLMGAFDGCSDAPEWCVLNGVELKPERPILRIVR